VPAFRKVFRASVPTLKAGCGPSVCNSDLRDGDAAPCRRAGAREAVCDPSFGGKHAPSFTALHQRRDETRKPQAALAALRVS